MERLYVTRDDCKILARALHRISGTGPLALCNDCNKRYAGCNCPRLVELQREWQPVVENGLDDIFRTLAAIRELSKRQHELEEELKAIKNEQILRIADFANNVDINDEYEDNPLIRLLNDMEL